MKKIFAMLAAAACLFAVSCGKDDNKGGSLKNNDGGDSELAASLKYSKYIPVILDGESAKAIESKIAVDLRPNDTTNWLWIWDETYAGGAGAGLNFYGNTEGYTDLIVGSVGWSGGGFCIYSSYDKKNEETGDTDHLTADPDPFTLIKSTLGTAPQDWTFHLAFKGAARQAHLIGLDYAGSSYKFVVGEGSMTDAGVTYNAIAPVSGEYEAGEWMEYEIPVADLGLDYSSEAHKNGENVVWFLSGPTAGNELKIDAVFFYKK